MLIEIFMLVSISLRVQEIGAHLVAYNVRHWFDVRQQHYPSWFLVGQHFHQYGQSSYTDVCHTEGILGCMDSTASAMDRGRVHATMQCPLPTICQPDLLPLLLQRI